MWAAQSSSLCVLQDKSDAIAVAEYTTATAVGAASNLGHSMSDWPDVDDLPEWHVECGSDLAVSTGGAPSATSEFSGDESVAELDDLLHNASFCRN